MKQFMNAKETLVTEAIDGLLRTAAGGWRGWTDTPTSRWSSARTGTVRAWRWSRAAAPGMNPATPGS
jgi:hypothetical protein